MAGLLMVSLASCGLDQTAQSDTLETEMEEAATTIPGVQSANAHVNMNTSGNFITIKLVGTSADPDVLGESLKEALPVILNKARDLDGGTFSISIFSPDDTVGIGPSDIGYPAGTGDTLNGIRQHFPTE
ncbi:hypothetical protein [Pseudarthrobacter scleromae]|jgi:hypothetical protein|uniref:Lipoprotein n=1 Tax=Pseudarthrobacter scleromae TaxID=158897 RepID=A0ABQ2CFM6_9MICC|nr:hypothetical protein [Pseudarthrobacter scleromae]GGI83334.1 hypothetical protein GCM10007175_20880 [Pseudarthrobacter scleromae]